MDETEPVNSATAARRAGAASPTAPAHPSRITAVFLLSLVSRHVRNLLAERGLDVSRQTVADWVQKFGILLAEAGRHHAKRVSSRWFVDETYVRVGKTWAYLYRAVDESGQVVDVLLREKRDVESARAFFEQAIKRRCVIPNEVVTDKHRAYLRAVKQHAPNGTNRRTGLHRKRALTTMPIERTHVPIKNRLRPMRGLGSVETGQLLLQDIELAQAVQRSDVRPPHQHIPGSVHKRSRFETATFSWLASGLQTAARATWTMKPAVSAILC